MAREAISGTWNEIAELWHAKSLKIIYIVFHTEHKYVCVCVCVCVRIGCIPFPVVIERLAFESNRTDMSRVFRSCMTKNY